MKNDCREAINDDEAGNLDRTTHIVGQLKCRLKNWLFAVAKDK